MKRYETDVAKIECWLSASEPIAFAPVVLQCPLEDMEQQRGQFQDICDDSDTYKNLVDSLCSQATDILPELSPSDKVIIEEQLQSLREKCKEVASKSSNKQYHLVDSIQQREAYEAQLADEDTELADLQALAKLLEDPISHDVDRATDQLQKAGDIKAKVVNQQPKMDSLHDSCAAMATSGQMDHAEDVSRLDGIYKDLLSRTASRCIVMEDAVRVRQAYAANVKEVQDCLEHCAIEMPALQESGMITEEKLEKCQALMSMVDEQFPTVVTLETQGQDILHTADKTDQPVITATNLKLKQDLRLAAENLRENQLVLEQTRSDKEALGKEVEGCLAWLKAADAEMREMTPIGLPAERVEEELSKHELSQPTLDKQLQQAQALIISVNAKYAELGEPIPLKLQADLEEMDALHSQLLYATKEKAARLQEALNLREDLERGQEAVGEWLDAAEEKLQEEEEGVDFEEGHDQLQKHKLLFAKEAICQSRLDEVEEIAEKILPSLSPEDAAKLKADLSDLASRLADTATRARNVEEELQDGVNNWQDFQAGAAEMKSALTGLEERASYQSPVSLAVARDNEQLSQEIGEVMQTQVKQLEFLKQQAEILDKQGNEPGKEAVQKRLQDLELLADSLQDKTSADNQKIKRQAASWQGYHHALQEVTEFMSSAERCLPMYVSPSVGNEDLISKLDSAKESKVKMAEGEASLERLQQASQILLDDLDDPTLSEPVREEMASVQDRDSRLQAAATETESSLEQELEDRRIFALQVEDVLKDLKQLLNRLAELVQSVGPELKDVEEKMNRQQDMANELNVLNQASDTLADTQQSKYDTLKATPPPEIAEEIERLRIQQAQVAEVMGDVERSLEGSKRLRRDFCDKVKRVEEVLEEVTETLQERVIDISEGKRATEEAQETLQEAKALMDVLHHQADSLTDQSNQPTERQQVIARVDNLQHQVMEMDESASLKVAELTEAVAPWEEYHEAMANVELWVAEGNSVTEPELVMTSPQVVQSQLDSHKNILANVPDITEKLDVLTATTEALSHICDSKHLSQKASAISERANEVESITEERRTVLEEAAKQWVKHGKELGELTAAVSQAKAAMFAPELETKGLHQQMKAQEDLLAALEMCEAKVEALNIRHAFLVLSKPTTRGHLTETPPTSPRRAQEVTPKVAGQEVIDPQLTELAGELEQLHQIADEHKDKLRVALIQQEEYDVQLEVLVTKIRAAQDRMASPVEPTTMEEIKRQLAEHDALAAEIQTYEDEISQLNEKTEKLREEAGARMASRLASYAKVNPPLQFITRPHFGVQAQLLRRGSPTMLPGLFATPQDAPASVDDGMEPLSAKMVEDIEKEDISDAEEQPLEASQALDRIPQRSDLTEQAPPSLASEAQKPLKRQDDMKTQVVTDQGLAYILRPLQETADDISGSSPLTGSASRTPGGGVGQPLPDYVVMQEIHPEKLPTVVAITSIPGTHKPLIIQDPRTGQLMAAEPAEKPEELPNQPTIYIPESGKVLILNPNENMALEACPVQTAGVLPSQHADSNTIGQEYQPPTETPLSQVEPGKAPEAALQKQIVTDKGLAFVLRPLEDFDLSSGVPSPLSGVFGVAPDGGDSQSLPAPDYVMIDDAQPDSLPVILGSDYLPVAEKPHVFKDPQTGQLMFAEPLSEPLELQSTLTAYIPDSGRAIVIDPSRNKTFEAYPAKDVPAVSEEVTAEMILPVELQEWKANLSLLSVEEQSAAETLPPSRSQLEEPQESERPVLRQIITTKGPAYILKPSEDGSCLPSPLSGQDGSAPDGGQSSQYPQYVISGEVSPQTVPNVIGTKTISLTEPLRIQDPKTGNIMEAYPAQKPEELNSEAIAFCEELNASPMVIHYPEANKVEVAQPMLSATKQPEAQLLVNQLITEEGPAYILKPIEEISGLDSLSRAPMRDEITSGPSVLTSSEVTELEKVPTVITSKPGLQSLQQPLKIKDPLSGRIMAAQPCEDPKDLQTQITAYSDDPKSGVIKIHHPIERIVPGEESFVLEKKPVTSELEAKSPPKQQLVTAEGPAYILRPLEKQTGPLDASPLQAKQGTTPDGSYYIISGKPEASVLPTAVSLRPLPDVHLGPLTISDPKTGKLLEAIPAVDPQQLRTEVTAVIKDSEDQPVKIYHPKKAQVLIAKPAKSMQSEETSPSTVLSRHPLRAAVQKRTLPEQQLVTEQGPVYVLTPLEQMPPEDAKRMQTAPITLPYDSELDKLPPVLSSRPLSETGVEAMHIVEPVSQKVMVAVPCVEQTQLLTEVTVFINETDKEVKIHHPQSLKPTLEAMSVVFEKQPLQLMTPEEQLSDEQLITVEGPAFILRPIRDTSPLIQLSATSHRSAGSIIGGTEICDIPTVKESKPISSDTAEPLWIRDPRTGEIMEAIPAVDPGQLQREITAYIKDTDEEPVKIHHPHTARGTKRPWTTSSEPSQLVEDSARANKDWHQRPIETGTKAKVSKKPEGYKFALGKSQTEPSPPMQEVEIDLIFAQSVETAKLTESPSFEKASRIPKQDDQLQPAYSSPISHQLVTEKGPAYILEPLDEAAVFQFGSPWEGGQGTTPGGGVGSAPADFLKVQEVPYEQLPRVIGTRRAVDQHPFTVQDPKTGKLLAAQPAHSLNDLRQSVSGYIPDGSKDQAMEIFDPSRKQVAVALPSEIAEDLMTALGGKSYFPSEPRPEDSASVPMDFNDARVSADPVPTGQKATAAIAEHPDGQMETSEHLSDSTFTLSAEPLRTSTPFSYAQLLKKPLVEEAISKPQLYQGAFEMQEDAPEPESQLEDKQDTICQLITDQGPVYVLKPIDKETIHPVKGKEGSAPDRSTGLPSVDFVISQDTLPQQQPPVVTGAREVPRSLSLFVRYPTTGQVLVAFPAESLKELDDELTAYIPDNASQSIRVHDPSKPEDQVAVPTEMVIVDETASAQSIGPSEYSLSIQSLWEQAPNDATSTKNEEPGIEYKAEEEKASESGPWQLVGKEGPIFVLKPTDSKASNPPIFEQARILDSVTGTPSIDLEISPESQLEHPPVVTGAQHATPTSKPMLIKDPKTSQTFIAVPAQSLSEVAEEKTVCIPGKAVTPIRIHDPLTGRSASASDDIFADEAELASRAHEVQKPGFKLPDEHGGEQQSSRKDEEGSNMHTTLVEEFNQLLTDQGPAYIVKPIDTFEGEVSSPLQGFGGSSSGTGEGPSSANFLISTESQPHRLPQVIGARKVSPSNPPIIQDPETGRTLVARPAQSLKDLEENISACIPDGFEEPVRIHNPCQTVDQIAIPTGQIQVDEAILSDRVGDIHKPLSLNLQDNVRRDKPSAGKEDEMEEDSQPKGGTSEESMQLLADQVDGAMVDSQPVDDAQDGTLQLLSDQGPVYVVTSLDSKSSLLPGKKEGASGGGAGPSLADFVISSDTQPMQEPLITGARSTPQSKLLIIDDPLTGQSLVARPAQSLRDFAEEVTACVPDECNRPIRIHDPHTTQDQIAVPAAMVSVEEETVPQITGKKKKSKKRKKKGTSADRKDTPKEAPERRVPHEEAKQLLTDQGPLYVLTPHGRELSSPMNGQQGLDGRVGPLSADFIISEDTTPQQLPVVTGARDAPKSQSFVIQDPRTREALVARPAESLSDLTKGITTCIPDDTTKPVRVHNPNASEDLIALPVDSAEQGSPSEGLLVPPVIETSTREETEQLLTDQGPLYVLKPVDGKVSTLKGGQEGDSVDGGEGPPSDFVMSLETQPKQQPVVSGARTVPQSTVLRVQDPRTGQTLLAKPAHSLNDLHDEVTASIPDQTDQPILVHNPSLLDDQIAVPAQKSPSDDQALHAVRAKKPKSPRHKGKKQKTKHPVPHQEEKMEETPSEVPGIQQLLSDQGPVFVLTPVDDASNPIKGLAGSAPSGGAGPPAADFVISPTRKPLQQPVITGSRCVPPTELLFVKEPRSGETLVAEPAKNLKDLKEKLTVCIPDEAKQSVTVHNPIESCDLIAYPSEPELVTERVSAEKLDSMEKPLAKRLSADPSERSMQVREDEPIQKQIITEKGPAYVLRPLGSAASPLDGLEGDTPDGGVKPPIVGDYRIADDAEPQRLPMAIGVRAAPQQRPLVVINPQTGEAVEAIPAQNVRDLYKSTIAYIEDEENGPMKIHDNDTGKVKVAYPVEIGMEPDSEAPMTEDQEDEPRSGESTPGFYTPETGSPARSRSNSLELAAEEPIQASEAAPRLTAFGFLAQVLGLTSKKDLKPKEEPATGLDGTDDGIPYEEAEGFLPPGETERPSTAEQVNIPESYSQATLDAGSKIRPEEPVPQPSRKLTTPVKTVRFADDLPPTFPSSQKSEPDSDVQATFKPHFPHPKPTRRDPDQQEARDPQGKSREPRKKLSSTPKESDQRHPQPPTDLSLHPVTPKKTPEAKPSPRRHLHPSPMGFRPSFVSQSPTSQAPAPEQLITPDTDSDLFYTPDAPSTSSDEVYYPARQPDEETPTQLTRKCVTAAPVSGPVKSPSSPRSRVPKGAESSPLEDLPSKTRKGKTSPIVGKDTSPSRETGGDRIEELNRSWDNLQQKMEEKQRMLRDALARQEDYHNALSELNIQLEAAEQKLKGIDQQDLDEGIATLGHILDEVEALQDKIIEVKEKGDKVVSRGDASNRDAIQATLASLRERTGNLLSDSLDKLNQLQIEREEQEELKSQLTSCKNELLQLETWLDNFVQLLEEEGQGAASQAEVSVVAIQQQLVLNQNHQLELSRKLQKLQDVQGIVDDIQANCPSREGETTSALAALLRTRAETLKRDLGDRQELLKMRRNTQQMAEEYQSDVQRLQEWLAAHRGATTATLAATEGMEGRSLPIDVGSESLQRQMDLQQRLEEELSAHQALLKSVARRGTRRRAHPATSPTEEESSQVNGRDEDTEDHELSEMRAKWQEISSQEAERKRQLLASLEYARPKETNGLNYPAPARRTLTFDLLDRSEEAEEDMQASVKALNQCWEKMQTQVEDQQTRLEQAYEFQSAYQTALQNVSSWLDNVQLKLFSSSWQKDTQAQLDDHSALQDEIHTFQDQLEVMNESCQAVLLEANEENRQLIQQALADLNLRMSTLETEAQQREQELREKNKRQKAFQDDAQIFQSWLTDAKKRLTSQDESDSVVALEDKINYNQDLQRQIQQLENEIQQNEARLRDVVEKGDQLLSLDPQSPAVGNEVSMLQTGWEDLYRQAGTRRRRLNKAKILQEQYHKILQDYMEFLDMAEQKLSRDDVMATDARNLREQLEKHKEFFSDLGTHHLTIESIAQKADPSTQELFASQRSLLDQRSHAIQAKATVRGQMLERLVTDWDQLEKSLEELRSWLGHVEAQLPSSIDDATQESVQKGIHKYQAMTNLLSDRKPTLQQVLNRGQALLKNVTSSKLDNQLLDLSEKWATVQSKISQELALLSGLLQEWKAFNQESASFLPWLRDANKELLEWGKKDQQPQEVGAMVARLEKFMAFRKDIDGHLPLKESVCNHGQQLLKVKKLHTQPITEKLRLIDSQWSDLQNELPHVQEELHQMQMELLPSRQALNELMLWMDALERMLDDHKEKTYSSSNEVDAMMQIYRGYKIDLSTKLLTVEFVNQSMLHMSQDLESKREDKTDFAERLGAMNQRWETLNVSVTEVVKRLDSLQQDWLEWERQVRELTTWLDKQEAKLRKCEGKVGHETSVEQAVKMCQTMEDSIDSKQSDITKIQQTGQTLAPLETVLCTVQDLEQSRDGLTILLKEVRALLITALEQWRMYHECLQAVSASLGKAEYCISRVGMATGTLDSLEFQLNKFKDLQAEFTGHRTQLTNLCRLADQLGLVCKSSVCESLDRTVNDLTTRWNNVDYQLRETVTSFEKSWSLWHQFEERHDGIEAWLIEKENECECAMAVPEESDVETDREADRVTERAKQVETCKKLLDELKSYHEIDALRNLVDQLTRHMDGTTANNIASRRRVLSLKQDNLCKALKRFIKTQEADLKMQRQLRDKIQKLLSWLEDATDVINMDDPNRSSDETSIRERMAQLKAVMVEFSGRQSELNSLNEMGYRLSLNRTNAADLSSVNNKWNASFGRVCEKYRRLQGVLLQQQSFAQKCTAWSNFIEETEKNLAVVIAGSYLELLDQQKIYEVFESDIFNRQQILFSIINDGQRMVQDGDLDDPEEFQLQLDQLSEQWQSVIRRTAAKKDDIDKNIRAWNAYYQMLSKMQEWLEEIEEEVKAYDITTAPLQRIRSLADQAKGTQRSVELQETLYLSLNDAGKSLLRNSDSQSAEKLKLELTDVQNSWHQVTTGLRKNMQHLEEVIGEWEGSDALMDELHDWLRSNRKVLSQPLPHQYDELQRGLDRCKEIENSFDATGSRLEKLRHLEGRLQPTVSPDDMAVLSERIALLSKQWEEVHHQTCQRRQQITDRLNEWATFTERYKEFCDWLTQMEVKIVQNGEHSIEDLLAKLTEAYQEEIESAKSSKEQLQELGQRLITASNEARASDIEYKLAKLAERWNHLMELVGARVKKLQGTLTAVQELDQNMGHLRHWLTQMEKQLASPIMYETCDKIEIQAKLQTQQEIQKDIERHSKGVTSVLNLCEMLLHDTDACSSDADNEAIQTAARTLDQRWRAICSSSMERKMKIEETWRLWQRFIDDYTRFDDWLTSSERIASNPHTTSAPFAVIKEEIKKFDMFQRKVQENFTQLEILNKQYRRLAREGRADRTQQLKTMVQQANDRWDDLVRRCSAILRRLRYAQSQKEEFAACKESMHVWLTEMDLQLTNVEHFSESDISVKIKQMMAFQHEIELNRPRLQEIVEHAQVLMQRSDPHDSAFIQEEMDELQRYSVEVFDRVRKFQRKLERLSMAQYETTSTETEEDSEGISSRDISPDRDSPSFVSSHRSLTSTASVFSRSSRGSRKEPPAQRSRSNSRSASPSPAHEGHASGRITPASAVSLDWDMYVSGNTQQFSEAPGEETGRFKVENQHIQQAMEDCLMRIEATENALRCRTPTGPEIEDEKEGYDSLVEDCRVSVDVLKRLAMRMPQDDPVLTQQIAAVLNRWEILQADILDKDSRLNQNYKQWHQFRLDLNNLNSWLDEAEVLLSTQETDSPAGDLEGMIRRHREFILGLNARKAIALSINLCSQQFLRPDSRHTQALREELSAMNQRWDRVCGRAADWQKELQLAIMQCEEFHQTTADLMVWLDGIEATVVENEPIDLSADENRLHHQYRVFMKFKRELQSSQPKVSSLKETADQLLVDVESEDCQATRDKLHLISRKITSLLRRCEDNLELLETTIDPTQFELDKPEDQSIAPQRAAFPLQAMGDMMGEFGSTPMLRSGTPVYTMRHFTDAATNTIPEDEVDGAAIVPVAGAPVHRRRSPFISRALRAALPLHLLMLLLLGVACLVPMTEEDYSCTLTNNFARSLQPMLRFTNGPPPI
ncbi:nesprin-1-like isoform X2 [Acanthaster planci]|uniref:Nesprin-1-like isoform X2 n=1 Tax=Acanthaster planci TaxID=133434 RepID=A0A8B7YT84_ACAPL|nr:nesprin-1-like isoform X2 [Acanthaster planci]